MRSVGSVLISSSTEISSLNSELPNLVIGVCAAAVASCAPAPPAEITSCRPVTDVSVSSHACYRLGEGEFRGVLWPSLQENAFTVVLVNGTGDHDFRIVAPTTDVRWGTGVVDAAPVTVKANPLDPSTDIYSLSFEGGQKLNLSLPRGRARYTFQFHDIKQHGGGVTFMNLDAASKERGIFGFVSWRI